MTPSTTSAPSPRPTSPASPPTPTASGASAAGTGSPTPSTTSRPRPPLSCHAYADSVLHWLQRPVRLRRELHRDDIPRPDLAVRQHDPHDAGLANQIAVG